MTEIMDVLKQMVPRPSEMESPYVKTLRAKQDLLIMLLENEHARLTTWLFPLDTGRKTHYNFRSPADVSAALVCGFDNWLIVIQNVIGILLKTAWLESPQLAIQLTKRFQSSRLSTNVRSLLLRYPEQIVDIPETVPLILGDGVPPDVGLPQLKVWAYTFPF